MKIFLEGKQSIESCFVSILTYDNKNAAQADKQTGGYYGGIKMWCRKLYLQSG